MDRLKILLYISPKNDAEGVNHEWATRLAHSMEQSADVHLCVSPTDSAAEHPEQYHIVHILGCWHTASCRLLSKARRLHIPTVYSPLGGLQPWVLRKHMHSPIYNLQKQAIEQASAVHLCSKLESDTFAKLNWNGRQALIKNPILTSLITFEQLTDAMLALYHKVLDSHARLLLSPQACQVIGHLLQLGVDKDVLFDHAHCDSLRSILTQLTPADWRRIAIYAAEEQLGCLLATALERLNVEIALPDISTADRFTTTHSYADGALNGDKLCFQSTSLTDKLTSLLKEDEHNERFFCIQLLNLKYETAHHTAPLHHLVNIYSTLRHQDMNEDKLEVMMHELDAATFAQQLMGVLRDVMRLSEGFMPFHVKEGKGMAELETRITKFHTWP